MKTKKEQEIEFAKMWISEIQSRDLEQDALAYFGEEFSHKVSNLEKLTLEELKYLNKGLMSILDEK